MAEKLRFNLPCLVLAITQALSLSLAFVNSAQAEQPYQLKAPNFRPAANRTSQPVCEADILLVMPAMKTDLGMTAADKAAKEKLIKEKTGRGESVEELMKDEVADALNDVHANVIRSFGEGEDLVLVVKTEKGKLLETEAKLSKDKKHFSALQRNYQATSPTAITTSSANDPYYPSQWYLKMMQVPDAWQISKNGAGITVANIDSAPANLRELAGRIYYGFDPEQGRLVKQLPVFIDHGSKVCTGAFAETNNKFGVASAAPNAIIFPMSCSPAASPLYPNEELILRDLLFLKNNAKQLRVKIINIEAQQSSADYSYFNPQAHPTLHKYLRDLYNQGLITVVPMGNFGFYDPNPRVNYMVGVSGIDSNMMLFNHGYPGAISAFGAPVWFAAAGKDVWAYDKEGTLVSTGGTSLAAPLIAAQIAQVWSTYPQLTNSQILQVMKESCAPISYGLEMYYGFGIPRSYTALQKAKATARTNRYTQFGRF